MFAVAKMRRQIGRAVATLEVELLFLSAQQGSVQYRVERAAVPDGVEPDAVARDMAGPRAEFVHSTSWRHEPPSTVRLTYVTAPDAAEAQAVTVDTTLVLSSGDPLRPQPPDLHLHHVAAHAIRHVSALADSDPAMTPVVLRAPELWNELAAYARRTATGVHPSAHDDAALA